MIGNIINWQFNNLLQNCISPCIIVIVKELDVRKMKNK